MSVTHSTHGFDLNLRPSQSPSPTTTGLQAHDSEANNPRTAALESSAELQSNGVRAQSPTSELSSGLACGSQVGPINVRPVDRRTIEGSYAGDSRKNPGDVAKSDVDRAADNGGPRSGMGQTPISGRTPASTGTR